MNASDHFEREAGRLVQLYEQTTFDRVHHPLEPYLPAKGAEILDIGSGSGRDAAALAKRGYRVTAVEPSSALLKAAQENHPQLGVLWLKDELPGLRTLNDQAFDFVLLSAVWMYVPAIDRPAALQRLRQLTVVNGLLALSVRKLDAAEPSHFSLGDVEETADSFVAEGFSLLARHAQADALGRSAKTWTLMVFSKSETEDPDP